MSVKKRANQEFNNILIDSGVALGDEISSPLLQTAVDMIFVTHAHADHSGRIPQIALKNPHAPIYVAEGAKSTIAAMISDAWKYQVRAKEHGTVGT
ncbi:MBL fold metallo-hydrolase [Candidatus Peribacteria bacterium]|nr:MBL fold metallo-hydrolase [Candidatus Peribacteria bacterium]